MTKSKLFAAAAIALLTAAGAAQAETYEGVHPVTSGLSRTEVQDQAVAAAHAKNQNVASGSLVAASVSQRDRSAVQREAVAAAANPLQNLSAGSKVNSVVVPTSAPAASAASGSQGTRM